MNENVTLVFQGFLNLPNLEKLKLVEAINEYFDSNERESIRRAHDENFKRLNLEAPAFICKCCGN